MGRGAGRQAGKHPSADPPTVFLVGEEGRKGSGGESHEGRGGAGQSSSPPPCTQKASVGPANFDL